MLDSFWSKAKCLTTHLSCHRVWHLILGVLLISSPRCKMFQDRNFLKEDMSSQGLALLINGISLKVWASCRNMYLSLHFFNYPWTFVCKLQSPVTHLVDYLQRDSGRHTKLQPCVSPWICISCTILVKFKSAISKQQFKKNKKKFTTSLPNITKTTQQ